MLKIILLITALLSAIGVWAADSDSLENWADSEFIARNKFIPEVIQSLETEKFSFSYSKRDIPKSLNKIETYYSPELLKALKNNDEWKDNITPVTFANPNQQYNCCCEPTPGLPYRKIILILKNRKHFIVTYHRGAGPTSLIMILWTELNKAGKVKKLWVGEVGDFDFEPNNKANILKLLKNNDANAMYAEF